VGPLAFPKEALVAQKFPFDEHTRVSLVTAITDIDAPTVAELNAGTDITCHLTKDGLNPGGTTNAVDSAGLCSRVDSQVAGSVGYSFTLRGFRYADSDSFWTLANHGDATHVVVRRGDAHDDAWAAADKVEVYKVQMGEPIPAPSAANTLQTFELALFVEDAELKATVAA
jgi:hypothetical protein